MAIVDKINALTGKVNGNGSIEDALEMLIQNKGGGSDTEGDTTPPEEETDIIPEIVIHPSDETFGYNTSAATVTCDMSVKDICELYESGKIHTVKVSIDMSDAEVQDVTMTIAVYTSLIMCFSMSSYTPVLGNMEASQFEAQMPFTTVAGGATSTFIYTGVYGKSMPAPNPSNPEETIYTDTWEVKLAPELTDPE